MRFLDLKIPPVIVVLLSLLGMYFTQSVFPRFPMPQSLATLFAIAIFISAGVFGLMAVRDFKRHQTTVNPMDPNATATIIKTGVFGVTRNPIYVAMVMIVAAAGLYWLHTGVIIFVLFTFFYLQEFQIKPEERALKEKFGEEFEHYLSRVPRWF